MIPTIRIWSMISYPDGQIRFMASKSFGGVGFQSSKDLRIINPTRSSLLRFNRITTAYDPIHSRTEFEYGHVSYAAAWERAKHINGEIEEWVWNA